jgi:DNA-binding response OmpR family regulator
LDKTRILLIEGKRNSSTPSFFTGLSRKGYSVETVPTGAAALACLQEFNPQLVLVDAASMRTNGNRISQSVRQSNPKLPLILVVAESQPIGNNNLEATSVLQLPFTLQKLINRIRALLPVESQHIVTAGQLILDLEEHRVRYQGRQAGLTPRLVALLKTLMDHAGEVVDRKALFSTVWETDYTADTRTLDVHISWLRQALEDDPRDPKLIKTMRGIGYRLDIDSGHRPQAKTARTPTEKNR